MKKNNRRILAFTSILFFQFLFVVVMIADKERTLGSGKEVVFRVVPVDPRSLFRGDYVILNFSFSRIDLGSLEPGRDKKFKLREKVYVKLEQKDGVWVAGSIRRKPFSGLVSRQIMLKGFVQKSYTGWVRVEYGIESFFVPEGRGKKIETDMLKNRVKVKVAVGKNGEAVSKGLLIDDKPVVFK